MTPEVSIITPCHNSANFLLETIASVQNQTFQNWEMILVDDGSADHTAEIIEAAKAQDSRIRSYAFEHNVGPALARNKGIEMAVGRFIAFLDSDDLWLPKKLEVQIAFMKNHNYALTYGAYQKTDENLNALGILQVPDSVTYHDILKSCSIGCLTAVYDTQILGKVFMPDILKRQDFGLWLRILKRIPRAYSVGQVLAKYRLRQASISQNKWVAAQYQWKIYRKIEGLSLLQSVWYFSNYFVRGILKTYFK